MDGGMDGWMDGWIDGKSLILTKSQSAPIKGEATP